ncbi:hypothetical protein A3G67_00270 [Candidatus Roizmanbacteria bacterium RIFCSPLOWO2_12_FULL_40_12]|uniref:Aminoacyl-tRNA hydrolase n=1 Tax=Candidatus Roizmanbacteria bacterium RIFCSPLOWO2_01_FULL_40_42 TaxID=1802066 RepID=A0A1F7J6K8_9BACT|nr:MAG: hypothetical protein A2779_02490 [Candidatus Roizmanbacteria bacterium RIFCSPHIGHO2_01_FULL_40_98]OGK29089.1 MAG: hypothetical protein A3C31_03275 [Candidatus Roizmanbacteria bacterium RIFCSPHIGHO2_02_FULL_40_53]OGK29323.1 MAG: hypothetical protein A2W49_05105 [Candidatus Roizmanbacteria bacterium RIFCSPHIGHO2_12_41_18]OGK36230.1 MAG: hypothetical protein A3E69_01315 [Candidatus Roizmanbacteria bacterium RIFCSPHIGHO2_12_FULL_40_130]OGK51219.1 MAG: hypothetical protein A3B50_03305 [Candi
MKLIAGLGNPGKKYEKNRHNAGFMLCDYILEQLELSPDNLKFNEKLKSALFKFGGNKKDYLFIEPQTYMNRSGDAVKAVLDYYKSPIGDLLVLYDDLDIRLGDFKIQVGTGPQLHNGVISLEQALGSRNFTHVRIGVDNRVKNPPVGGQIDGETYVLQDFTSKEKEELMGKVFPRIFESLSF